MVFVINLVRNHLNKSTIQKRCILFKKTNLTYLIIRKLRFFSREKGIRTLDALPHTRFPGVPLQPLEHLSFSRCKVTLFCYIKNAKALFLTEEGQRGYSTIKSICSINDCTGALKFNFTDVSFSECLIFKVPSVIL